MYDRGLTRLLAVAPRHTGCLTLPATVTSVADSALHGATLCGIEIKGAATVSFGEQGEFSCPYVIAPNPADYAEAFPGVDVTDKIDEIVVSNAAEGQLARTVGGMGLRAADVRSLTVSGTIGQADVEWLAQLPNLHFLNLAGATFTGSEVAFADNALCSLSLPQGRYALAITDCPFLGGSLTVPEGVTCLSCTGAPMLTAVRLPSTLTDLEPNSFNSSLVAEADLSACTGLASLSGFGSCHRLRTLLLPAGLQVLSGAYGPVETVTLPEGLRELSVGGWNVETLRLPSTLRSISGDGIVGCAKLTELDLQGCAALEGISSLRGLTSLTTLRLPADLRSIECTTAPRSPTYIWPPTQPPPATAMLSAKACSRPPRSTCP